MKVRIRRRYTAPGTVTRKRERRLPIMDNEKITLYRATMSAVKKMLDEGLISEEEYAVIDTIMAEKYGLSLSVIFR